MTKLTRNNFKAWLESKEPNDIVGKARDSYQCPLARFLGKGAMVTSLGYSTPRGRRDHILPVWAQRFVNKADYHRSPGFIFADRALEILDKS
jgi:hypothetical protein